MEIAKLHCLGNEYFVLHAEAGLHPLPVLACTAGKKPSARGVKGLIILLPGVAGSYRVEIYNFQGIRTLPGTCALLCAGHSLGTGAWELDTDAGRRRVEVHGAMVRTWLPPPVFGGEYCIGRYHHGYLFNLYRRFFVTFGNNMQATDFARQCQAIDRYFGGVDVVMADARREAALRIWQRGCEMPGSATAACVAAACLHRLGRRQEPLRVGMPGGEVTVAREGDGGFVLFAPVRPGQTLPD
ncbi:MAG TPA: hypothetical protein PKL39_08480 [Bacillota bacterium]|nr:hypothetical protein [Bacillota bacterium]HQE01506.1 hypothetical protein [Bacillota bacterium]